MVQSFQTEAVQFLIVLSIIIHQDQVAFIKNKYITSNIILANELTYNFNSTITKKKKKSCAKVILNKAFDEIN